MTKFVSENLLGLHKSGMRDDVVPSMLDLNQPDALQFATTNLLTPRRLAQLLAVGSGGEPLKFNEILTRLPYQDFTQGVGTASPIQRLMSGLALLMERGLVTGANPVKITWDQRGANFDISGEYLLTEDGKKLVERFKR
jgi:hypothetical protein